MRIRIFTLKFHPGTEQFDDDELQEFIKDKEVLSAREHFFLKHETPYLVVFITYLPGDRDMGIAIVPFLRKLLQCRSSFFLSGRLINQSQVFGHGLPLFAGDIAEGVADLMDDTLLDFRFRKDSLDGFGYTSEIVHREDQNIPC